MSLPKIDMPIFELEVPSTKEKVKMRPMRVKDEKILLMAREGNDKYEIYGAIKQVVNNCLVDKVDIDKLAMFDVDYMFLKLRSQSVSSIAQVAYTDGDDKKTRNFEVDLNKVIVKFPKDFDSTIKVSKTAGIIMKFPPASLYSNRTFLESQGETMVDILVNNCIEAVYDEEGVIDPNKVEVPELMEWLDNLDLKSGEKIRDYLNNMPSLFYEIKYTNENGKERTITLSVLSDFFTLA